MLLGDGRVVITIDFYLKKNLIERMVFLTVSRRLKKFDPLKCDIGKKFFRDDI